MKRLVFALAVLLTTAAIAAELPPTVGKIGDSTIDESALYLPAGQWGRTLNGRSFQQSALASFNGWQYATHFDADRRLCVDRRTLSDDKWEVIRFEDYRFKGNDTHNAAVLGICPTDGTIHLSFDHHNHPLHYRVSRAGVATDPVGVKWTPELFGPTTDQLEAGKKITRVTYPRFLVAPDQTFQFQCRIGGSGNGDAWLADYSDGKWRDFSACISGAGAYEGDKSRNAYENGYTYDSRGRLHVTWCWRETGDPMTNHDLLYAWSDDRGKTWRNDAGGVIGQRGTKSMNLDSPGLRVWEIPTRRGLMNSTTQATDSRNRIHVITWHLPDNVEPAATWEATRSLSRYFHYWRDDAGAWHRTGMSFIGNRGQMCFDANDDAYLVFVADDKLQIAAADAKDGWSQWRIIRTEPGAFIDQPLIDTNRVRDAGVMSVFVQEAPSSPQATASPLRVIEYRLGSVNQ